MIYLAGILLVILLGYLLLQWFANARPQTIAKLVLGVGIGLAMGLAGFFLVTGKLAAAFPIFFSALGALWRQRWLLNLLLRRYLARARPGSSDLPESVRTTMLEMVLDKATGRLSGTVMSGAFKGRALDGLSVAELQELKRELDAGDPDGARLLAAYMARRGTGADAGQGERGGAQASGMSREEALEILGLDTGASEAEIRDAHRRLIRKLHPDQGGSGYLAAKINQAKSFLLEG